MTKIVIEIASFQDAILLAEFAKRLNGVVHFPEPQESTTTSAFECLEELAKTDAFIEIEDVVEWQSQLRQDRVLAR